jgi:hypothetical protein
MSGGAVTVRTRRRRKAATIVIHPDVQLVLRRLEKHPNLTGPAVS